MGSITDIVDYFDELADPRASINLKHPLLSVVVIAMRGVLAGAHGPTAIARWAKIKKQFAWAIRSHWGIENGCHWSLDMIYREDESRTREPNMRENFAWLNRFTLSLLKQHPDKKQSTIMKRRNCGWSENFLLEVTTGTTT